MNRLTSTDERANARFEFGQRKRFGHVIVSAQIQTLDAIGFGVPGSQYENAASILVGPQFIQYFESADAGKTDVQDNEIEFLFRSGFQGQFTGGGVVNGVATAAPQGSQQSVRQRLVVLYKQNSHTFFAKKDVEMRVARESRMSVRGCNLRAWRIRKKTSTKSSTKKSAGA